MLLWLTCLFVCLFVCSFVIVIVFVFVLTIAVILFLFCIYCFCFCSSYCYCCYLPNILLFVLALFMRVCVLFGLRCPKPISLQIQRFPSLCLT